MKIYRMKIWDCADLMEIYSIGKQILKPELCKVPWTLSIPLNMSRDITSL